MGRGVIVHCSTPFIDISRDSVKFDLGRRCDGGDLPKMGVAKEAQRVEMGEIPKK